MDSPTVGETGLLRDESRIFKVLLFYVNFGLLLKLETSFDEKTRKIADKTGLYV